MEIHFADRSQLWGSSFLQRDSYQVDSAIIEAIVRFSTPSTCTDLWSLFGLTNQLSTSTDKTAALLEPFHPMLCAKNEFCVDSQSWHNTNYCQVAPVSEPILMCPHPLACTQMQAAGYGLGFIPQQQLPYKDNSTFVIDIVVVKKRSKCVASYTACVTPFNVLNSFACM